MDAPHQQQHEGEGVDRVSGSSTGAAASSATHAGEEKKLATPSPSDPAALPAQPEKKPLPGTVASCVASIDNFSSKVEAFNQKTGTGVRTRQEGGWEYGEDADPGQRDQGDPWYQRYIIVPIVFGILIYVYVAYTWRVLTPMLQQTDQALGARRPAVVLIILFNLLWLMSMWTYLKVLLTSPGYSNDQVEITYPPRHAEPTEPAPYPEQFVPGDAHGAAEPIVDSTVAAAVGPIGAGLLERAQPESETQGQNGQGPNGRQPDPFKPTETPARTLLPEPVRIPLQHSLFDPLPRYCVRCSRIKPPRTHHCRHCGRCVLKMDHHCPWVGGCVGAQNHKFFMNFVFWVTWLELLVLVSTGIFFGRGVSLSGRYRTWNFDGFIISLLPISALFLFFTGALLGSHIFLLVNNLSTIEHMRYEQKERAEETLLSRYFSKKGEGGAGLHFGDKRRIKRKWNAEWGKLRTEGNPWWIGGADELVWTEERGTSESVEVAQKFDEARTRACDEKVAHSLLEADAGVNGRGAWMTNFTQVMGNSAGGWLREWTNVPSRKPKVLPTS